MSTLRLRPYQERIVDSVGTANSIIKMPTGSGKTFVACELIRRCLATESSRMAVFLVPACDLVDQQAASVEKWCPGLGVARFRGGMSSPSQFHFRAMVTTPQAFVNLQDQEHCYGWSNICLVVFDECHHVLKEHPYRKIALRLKLWRQHARSNLTMQTIGLSASLTYAVGDLSIQSALANLCHDLCIEKMESPSTEDLIAGGYVPQDGNFEIRSSHEVPDGVLPVSQRQPHAMYQQFCSRLHNNASTEVAKLLWKTVEEFEKYAEKMDTSFISPLGSNKLAAWEEYASQKCSYAFPLSRDVSMLYKRLEVWYVALRLLVQTWEEEEQLVLEWLKINDAFSMPNDYPNDLRRSVEEVKRWATNAFNLMKLSSLRDIILEKKSRFGDSFRALVFVQQRLSAFIVSHYINDDPHLSSAAVRSEFVVSRGAKLTPSIKMTPSEVARRLDKFRFGSCNVIVSTSVIEEGFDVPAANVVVSFNAMKDSVELCQRSGRARSIDSCIVVMDERRDRPVSRLEAVRRSQDDILNQFDPDQVQVDQEQEMERQRIRDRSGLVVLQDTARCHELPVLCLNEYKAKTKAHLDEAVTQHVSGFRCTLVYMSLTKRLDCAEVGPNKKAAKTKAAATLLHLLRQESGLI